MKKILCFLLIGVICMGLFGCGVSGRFTVFPSEQKAMLAHLAQKYGEPFVIKETFTPGWSTASSMRGAMVHPEGKEDELFLVEIISKDTFVDEYVLRLPEQRMQPLYEEWIQGVISSAKVSVRLDINFGGTKEVIYNPDETLQQFVSEAERLNIEVNIMLSEAMLESKDEIFEKLSKLLESEPISGYKNSKYTVAFLTHEAFENIKSGEYKNIPEYLNPIYEGDDIIKAAKEFVAITYCYTTNSESRIQTQAELIQKLNRNLEIKEEYIE